jgi:phthalate 4,5-dioxygenase
MLSAKDNELMCRTGRNTPMGKAMRHFWLPALLSSELPQPDCDPVHVELLGENFVAFRDSEGRVGMLDEMCCHRGASLTLGRAENCGLRCIYHGWLFATDGTVLETPNVPEENFKTRFKAKSYPVREAGGIIWTYIGELPLMPRFYDFSFLDAPKSQVLAVMGVHGCNYAQVLEGLVDSTHLSVLHFSQLTRDALPDIPFVQSTAHMAKDAMPKVEAEETPFGFHYGAVREIAGKAEVNVTAFVSPFFILNPNNIYLAVVPMTDEKCAFYWVWHDGERNYGEVPLREEQLKATGLDMLEEFGMTRETFYTDRHPSRANRYRQDRKLMRTGHHTGIDSLIQEDLMVTVSAGGIRDRDYEHLSSADAAVGMMYRVLLKSVRQLASGQAPIGYGRSVGHLQGARVTLPVGSDWRSAVPGNFQTEADAA